MFSQVSVILFTGGTLGVCGRHPPDRHSLPWADTPRQTPPRQTPPWADTPPANTPSPYPVHAGTHLHCPVHAGIHTPCPVHAGIHPIPTGGHCSGRYASYWNAFLLLFKGSHCTLSIVNFETNCGTENPLESGRTFLALNLQCLLTVEHNIRK